MTDLALASDGELIGVVAEQQLDTYRRQYRELLSHYNREQAALDGYRGRQLLELLQNADDAGEGTVGGNRVLFRLTDRYLVVANTGRPFVPDGIYSLVISDCSPKQLDRMRYIGCKGLGFRSVLTWSDSPVISSGAFTVAFCRQHADASVRTLAVGDGALAAELSRRAEGGYPFPAPIMRFPFVPKLDSDWASIAHCVRDEGYDTVIVLPFPEDARAEPIIRDVAAQLAGIKASTLLFCNHLRDARIEREKKAGTLWHVEREALGEGRQQIVILPSGGKAEKWVSHHRRGALPESLLNDLNRSTPEFELRIAIPEATASYDDGRFFSYFPTDDVLPIAPVLHATVELTETRKRLVHNDANRHIIERLGQFLAEVLESLEDNEGRGRGLELLRGLHQCDPALERLGFVTAIVTACKDKALFPRMDGRLTIASEVRLPPHAVWRKVVDSTSFGEVSKLGEEAVDLLKLFRLGWYSEDELIVRLERQVTQVSRRDAGRIVGILAASCQLPSRKLPHLLIDSDGKPLSSDVTAFVKPSASGLPALPAWVTRIRFLDVDYTEGFAQAIGLTSGRALVAEFQSKQLPVDEYQLEAVGRQILAGWRKLGEVDEVAGVSACPDVLRWFFAAQTKRDDVSGLSRLPIPVLTQGGAVRRATQCYLSPAYPMGSIIHALYAGFGVDEFVADHARLGLSASAEEVEEFLVAIGVGLFVRMEAFNAGSRYQAFIEYVVRSLDYPRRFRGANCGSADEALGMCRSKSITGLTLPDRFFDLLERGDATQIVAYLLAEGDSLIRDELISNAKFSARLSGEKKEWIDSSITVRNPVLHFLRTLPWVPCVDGARRPPSRIILSRTGSRVLQGVYFSHALNVAHPEVVAHGGRPAVDGLMLRLGAIQSLDSMESDDAYALLESLPALDPSGKVAKGIYRSFIENGTIDPSSRSRSKFIEEGKLWSHYGGKGQYLPVREVRYNAGTSLPASVMPLIPLADFPQGKGNRIIEQAFGARSLTAADVSLAVVATGTEYQPCSEAANEHLRRRALPFIYALRLAETVDDRGEERKALFRAELRVCRRLELTLSLLGRPPQNLVLDRVGERAVVGGNLYVVWGEDTEDGTRTRFWFAVANLLGELLSRDVAPDMGSVLRCRRTAEMKDVVAELIGLEADAKMADAVERLTASGWDEEEVEEKDIPTPKDDDGLDAGEDGTSEAAEGALVEAGGDNGAHGASDVGPPVAGAGTENGDGRSKTTFGPATPPPKSHRRVKRRIVRAPSGGIRLSFGPVASEDVTFRVVEEFERDAGRFPIRVSHLHGSDGFGCDIISVENEAISTRVNAERKIALSDIIRFIEVKGRSSRTGEVELTDNEYRAAELNGPRYFIYRVFVDADLRDKYEIGIIADPLNSNAVRTVTRFDLSEGSGAEWFSVYNEDEPLDAETQKRVEAAQSEPTQPTKTENA